MSDAKEKATQKFIEYTNDLCEDECLDINDQAKQRTRDEEARVIIKKVCNLKNAIDLQQLDCYTKNTYLRMLKQKYNLSIRQIERLTGINRGIILKA